MLASSKDLDESKLTKRQRESIRRYRRVSGGQVDLISDENEFENIGIEDTEGYDSELFKKLLEEEEGIDKYVLNNFHKSNREMANTFEVSAQTVANHRKKL